MTCGSTAPHLLSGGQKQRVAIAGVIAMMPRCIVLDEATAMLDPVGRRETCGDHPHPEPSSTASPSCSSPTTWTRPPRPSASSSWPVGTSSTTAPPAQVFQHVDTLRSAGLAVPETVALLYALKQEGFDVPLDAISDEACAQVLADLLKKPPHLGGE